MKFKVDIGGITVLLDADGLERLVDLVADNECLARNWSNPKGGNPFELKPTDIDNLQIKSMPQAQYDTYKLADKLAAKFAAETDNA